MDRSMLIKLIVNAEVGENKFRYSKCGGSTQFFLSKVVIKFTGNKMGHCPLYTTKLFTRRARCSWLVVLRQAKMC